MMNTIKVKSLKLMILMLGFNYGLKAQTESLEALNEKDLSPVTSFKENPDKSMDSKTSSPREFVVDYYKNDFNPFLKGSWFTKVSFSLSDKNHLNTPRLFDEVKDGQNNSWDLAFTGGHFISDYFMLGASFSYAESFFEGSLIDNNSDEVYRQMLNRSFTIAPHVRLAIPMTRDNRLSFYTDMGLSFSKGTSLQRETINLDEIQSSYSDTWSLGAGISPGVTFFLIENFALDVGINLIGYQMKIENVDNGEAEPSRLIEHDVNFKVNILSLNLGLAYYF